MDGKMSSQDRTPQLLKTCAKCGEEKPLTNFNYKGSHRKPDGSIIIYRDALCRKCLRKQKAAAGKCATCHSPAKPGHKSCEKHLKLCRDSVKRRNIRDKDAAFAKYGRQCKYCGDSRRIFLTIDHINNDGATHRKQLRAGNNHGHNIYAWLRLNHYPDGFQTLCYNCNCAKSHTGEAEVLKIVGENPHTTFMTSMAQPAAHHFRSIGYLCIEQHDGFSHNLFIFNHGDTHRPRIVLIFEGETVRLSGAQGSYYHGPHQIYELNDPTWINHIEIILTDLTPKR